MEKVSSYNNNQENQRIRDFIEKFYSKGRLAILFLMISFSNIGDGNYNFSFTKEQFIKKFTKGEKEEASKFFDEITKIMNPAELADYSPDYGNFPEELNDPILLKRFVELSKIFHLNQHILDISMLDNDSKKVSLLDDSIWKAICEIRNSFPKGIYPDIDFLPLNNLNYLKNPKYVDIFKSLAELNLTGNGSNVSERILDLILADSTILESLRKLSSFGAQIDLSIFSYLRNEDRAQKVKFFLDKKENQYLLSLLSNSFLGCDELNFLIFNDEEGNLVEFFQEGEIRKLFIELNKYGYTFSSFLGLERYKENLKDRNFVEFLIAIAPKLSDEAKNSVSIGFLLEDISIYFDFNNSDSLKEITEKVNLIKEKDLGYQRILDNIVNDKKTNVEKKIFNPLINELFQGYISNKTEPKIGNFLKDPALSIIYKLGYEDSTPSFLAGFSPHLQAEWLMRVARSMYQNNTPVNEFEFKKTFNEIVGIYSNKELLEIPLFKDRNIVFFVHNEKKKDSDLNRFGNYLVIEALRGQKPKTIKECRVDDFEKAKTQIENKESFIKHIINTEKLTILVSGHGSESLKVYSTDEDFVTVNNEKDEITIRSDYKYVSSDEIAEALEIRFDNGISDTPFLIMSTCYNQDFIRAVVNKILFINKNKNKKIPIPICIGDTEYGQLGFSNYNSDYNDNFLELLLRNYKQKETTIKNVIEAQSAVQGEAGFNVSFFISRNILSKYKKDKKPVIYQLSDHFDKNPKDKLDNYTAYYKVKHKNINRQRKTPNRG